MPLTPDHHLDLEDGRFAATTPQDLRALFQAVGQAPTRDHLVVHFHGGLVTRSKAHTGAEGLMPTYRAAGYPAFFIWNSGLLKTLRHNLDEIAQEAAFKRLVRRLAQFGLGKLAERATGSRGGRVTEPSIKRVPADLDKLAAMVEGKEATTDGLADPTLSGLQEDQLRELLEGDRTLETEARKIAAGLRPTDAIAADTAKRQRSRGVGTVRAATTTLMSAHVLDEIRQAAPDPQGRSAAGFKLLAAYGVRIFKAVLARYAEGRDHGLYTTIVEEVLRTLYLDNVGSLVWALMKGDTADAFAPDASRHGGTAFVEQLQAYWQPDRRVTLVGHSTGAIYIGHLLEAADALLPPEAQFDVVFLAPACTFTFLDERLELFRRRVRHLRIFGLTDETERGYWEIPLLYRGSLLYLVSGLLEHPAVDAPLVGMERYFTRPAVYDGDAETRVRAYLAGHCVWSPADEGPGRQTTAQKHGGFTEDPHIRQSLHHVLTHGYTA